MRPSISTRSISGEYTGAELGCIVPKRIFDSEYDENGCIAKSNLGVNQVPGVIEIGLPDSIIRA
tara:strand:+ start:1421 stop:1612 length:192 start_codon:yes stop_codon:yes gene_type:complete